MGRTRTKKRAQERAKERKQRRQRITLAVVGVIAVVIAVGAILATRPVAVEVDDELLTRYAGLPQSTNDRGFPILGNPEAPARLIDYSSFGCPACATFSDEVTKNIVERIAAGEVAFTYVPVLLPAEDDRAARAALCAEEQGFFWEYHDLLFNWQQVYQATAFQTSRIVAGAEALGMDVDEFNACRDSERITEVLDNAEAAFSTSGGTGTPTIIINGELVSPTAGAVDATIDGVMANAQPVPVVVDEEPAEEPAAVTETEEAVEEAAETEEAEVEETEAAADEDAEEAMVETEEAAGSTDEEATATEETE